MQNNMRHYINLIESAQTEAELLDEGPVGKALATAALALGLQFGQQVNAEEVYIYKDAQGQMQTAQSKDQIPAGMEFFIIDTDSKTVDVVDKTHTKQTDVEVDDSHISSSSFTTGINNDPVNAHSVQSNNIVNMSFPYKPHKGMLSLRGYQGSETPQLYFTVSGQVNDKRIRVKIDNLPVITTGVMGKTDDNSTIIIGLIGTYIIGNDRALPEKDWFAFMNDEEIKAYKYYKRKYRQPADENWTAMMVVANNALQRHLVNAKQIKIEVDLYNAPQRVYDFNVSNLFSKVNYNTDMKKRAEAYMTKRPPR